MGEMPNESQLPVQETKLFVGNLPQNITQEELRARLEPFGQLVDVHIMNKPSNRSGSVCAFVKYDSMESCQKAVAALDKQLQFDGQAEPCVVRLKNVSYDKGAKGTPVSIPGKGKGKGKGKGGGGNASFGGGIQGDGPPHGGPPGGAWGGGGMAPFPDMAPPGGAPNGGGGMDGGADHGWSEHKAPDGRDYFYNSKTGTSSWERPIELQQPPAMPAGPLPMLPGWDEFRAPDGRAYFYNAMSGESVWERPVDHQAVAAMNSYNQQSSFGGALAGGGGGGGWGKAPARQNSGVGQIPKIFVGDLPVWCEKEHVQNTFGRFGQIVHVHIMQGSSSSNKCAFVEFTQMDSATNAIAEMDQKHSMEEGGQPVSCRLARPPGAKGAGGRAAPY